MAPRSAFIFALCVAFAAAHSDAETSSKAAAVASEHAAKRTANELQRVATKAAATAEASAKEAALLLHKAPRRAPPSDWASVPCAGPVPFSAAPPENVYGSTGADTTAQSHGHGLL